MTETEIAVRRLMLATLNQTAEDWLGGEARKMFAMGQWSRMLNKIDPDSPRCASDEREARTWSEKAMLYLIGYRHGLMDSVTHKESSSA